MTDSYSGEPPLKGNMKMLPAGEKDNARKDEGLTERIYYNQLEAHSLKMEVKNPSVPISLEKKLNLWNDQRGNSEKIRKKIEEALSQTTGMASLTTCARLLGKHVFLRSISNKQSLNMAEGVLQALVDGIKETAAEKDSEMPNIKIKLELE